MSLNLRSLDHGFAAGTIDLVRKLGQLLQLGFNRCQMPAIVEPEIAECDLALCAMLRNLHKRFVKFRSAMRRELGSELAVSVEKDEIAQAELAHADTAAANDLRLDRAALNDLPERLQGLPKHECGLSGGQGIRHLSLLTMPEI